MEEISGEVAWRRCEEPPAPEAVSGDDSARTTLSATHCEQNDTLRDDSAQHTHSSASSFGLTVNFMLSAAEQPPALWWLGSAQSMPDSRILRFLMCESACMKRAPDHHHHQHHHHHHHHFAPLSGQATVHPSAPHENQPRALKSGSRTIKSTRTPERTSPTVPSAAEVPTVSRQ